MKAPAFWDRPAGLAARLRGPAASVYGWAAARRMGRGGGRPPVPVLCVGNFTVGGTGKTPAAIALAMLLRELGRRPAFLTRGYGGALPGPVEVDPGRHGPEAVGDEALLLARTGPTIVSRDRPAGAALAARGGADLIVMDDGLQNSSLAKDLSFAVVDAASGFGNGRVLPAGPLRAPLAAQWPRVHALVVVGDGAPGERIGAQAEARGLPVFRGRLDPDPEAAAALRGRRVMAFAGIGRPAKFFDTLRACGADVVRTCAFPDHHRFTSRELASLRASAEQDGLKLVTTEKDLARMTAPPAGVAALPVQLRFADPSALRSYLSGRLPAAGAGA